MVVGGPQPRDNLGRLAPVVAAGPHPARHLASDALERRSRLPCLCWRHLCALFVGRKCSWQEKENSLTQADMLSIPLLALAAVCSCAQGVGATYVHVGVTASVPELPPAVRNTPPAACAKLLAWSLERSGFLCCGPRKRAGLAASARDACAGTVRGRAGALVWV